ncbi:putative Ig domain-containing protein [Brevundimonas sp. G8]|uniref:putative Ig domain-containing protein n=1 Tax=Brevundimonas sp. G8 TaxID=1350776 RepID=UPI00135B9C13|nr:putative Ig domain-containing protein [Brevundimonas sp. G8]
MCVNSDTLEWGLYGSANGSTNPNINTAKYYPMTGTADFNTNAPPTPITITTSKASYTITPFLDNVTLSFKYYQVVLNSVTGSGADTISLWYADNCTVSGAANCIGGDANPMPTNAAFTLSVSLPVMAAPTVTSISPTTGPTSGGTTVILTGTNFTGTTAVSFGATSATGFTVNSATQITATAPANTGTVNIRVTAAGGTSAVAAANQYTYLPAPTVTAISPTSGPAGGGTTVILTGTNFTGATAVTFGATSATGFTVNSATQITATAPANTGTVNIRVTAAGGTSAVAAANQYTYLPAPTVTAISPTSGPAGGGTTVILTGTNFTGATAVTFGATSATGFTVNSATQVTATAPAGTGTVDVRVTTGGGTSATSAADQFTYVAAPTITVSPATLPNASVGVAYSQTVTAGGGTAPYSYAVTAGALPTGMILSAGGGVLSGTPTAGGSFTFTLTATDSSQGGGGPFSGSRAYTLTVAAATITLSPTTLPAGGVGSAYSQTIAANGGAAPYSYAVTAGALPAGMTLASNGALSGTPSSGGSFTFTVTATDSSTGSGPYSGSRAYTLSIAAPTVTLTPATLPAATTGAAYSQTVTAGGGVAPYSYAVTAGALPAGVTLGASGVVSGTPTAGGTFNFTITATDSATGAGPYSGSRAYALTVNAAALTLAPSNLPGGQSGVVYSQALTAAGGVAPYSYAVTAGALPTGLTLNASTGAIDGTPTAQGTFNFTAAATDSSTGAGPVSVSQAYSVVIAAPTIVIAPASLSAGVAGVAYSQTLSASGGTAPYAYTISAGVLPAGLSLSSGGALSGTPTASGSFNFTVTATDATTGAAAPYAGARAYTLVIGAPTVTVDTAALPAATVAVAYSQTLSASGGTAPYSYIVTAGALPAGVSLAADGTLSGTPIAGGTFNFTITTTDSSTGAGAPFTASRAYTLTVGTATIAITPTILPNATVATAYSQALTASGGVGPYSYAMTAGALPAGLTLASDGTLSGASSAGGTFNFTISATDSSGGSGPYSGAQSYTLTVSAPTLVLSSATLPNATAGATYSATISASGGTSPYSYAVTAGALPAGVSLASDGTLSGTPTAGGTFNFTITTTDSSTGAGAPFTASRAYALTVGAATIAITPTTLPAGQVEAIYSQGLSASGGTAPYAFVVTTGALPSGLTLSSAGVLSGTPTASGSYNFTVTATDSSAGSGPFAGTQAYALVIAAPNPPVAGNVSTTVNYGSTNNPITATLTGGTSDSVAVATAPAHGAVTVSGLGFLYTPAADYFGADSFTYTASNAGGTSSPATVSITAGTPPVPVTTNVSGVSVPYASPGLAIDLSGSISGVYDSVAVTTAPAHGTISVSGAVATYQPAADYFGADSFSFTATGPGGTSSASTVSLTVASPAPPTVTPPPAVVVPPASGGVPSPVSVDLGARTQGVTDGYRVTVDARFGSGVITSSGATVTSQSVRSNGAGPQATETFQLVYTPAANFIGTDTVTVVAFGPGGDSAPATFTFQVAGKAPDLSGSVASSGTLTVSPTATLVGGPFQALRITRQPAFGTAAVQGLTIVFTPGAANGGSTSLDYVIDLPFGSSAAGRLDLTVGQVPASQTLVADTIQGRPVTVRISNAAGGPFTGAAVTSISPTTAGSAAIAGTGGTYDLTFTPQGTFSGQATISFTLTNASGTTTGTLTVTVAARPDPSLDPDVRGVASGQITAARRFSDTQVDNFQRRLEGLRDGSNGSRNGMSLNFGGVGNQDDRDPRVALRRQLGEDPRLDPGALGDDRDRDMLGLDIWSGRGRPVEQASTQTGLLNAAPAGQGAPEGGRSVGVWTSGSVDWGRQDAQGLRDSRFTTQGVTAGLDVRLNDHLIVGGGLGYGEDKTLIGDNGSTSRGKATTGALYASWRPTDGWFVDGVVGMSQLDFDSRRWVVGLLDEADGYADGERSGDVRFASASVGRTLRRQGLAADLYVRVEGRDIALDGFTETNGGVSALTWDALDQSGLSVNLGASWRWIIESRRFGALRPTARLEWSLELEDIETQGVRYADWAASPTYLVPLDGWSRDALNLNLGAEWSLSDRLMLNLGYRGMLGDASSSHGGQIGLKYGW